MTPKDICYLLNCKNRIIKQQQDKLWEIRLITESKLIGCDDDEWETIYFRFWFCQGNFTSGLG